MVVKCLQCGATVLPTAEGLCPSCRTVIDAATARPVTFRRLADEDEATAIWRIRQEDEAVTRGRQGAVRAATARKAVPWMVMGAISHALFLCFVVGLLQPDDSLVGWLQGMFSSIGAWIFGPLGAVAWMLGLAYLADSRGRSAALGAMCGLLSAPGLVVLLMLGREPSDHPA